jgi:hypothetical protein
MKALLLHGMSTRIPQRNLLKQFAPRIPPQRYVTLSHLSSPSSNKSPQTSQGTASQLSVKATIRIWVDLNLPLGDESGVASALSFPPVKLLLTQAGQLLVGTVLKSTAPYLANLMIRDYEGRKKSFESFQGSESEMN